MNGTAKVALFWAVLCCVMFALSVVMPRGYVAGPIFWLLPGVFSVAVYTNESRRKS